MNFTWISGLNGYRLEMGCLPHRQAHGIGAKKEQVMAVRTLARDENEPTCAMTSRLTYMQSTHRSPQSVLYVEDNADDFFLFKLASKKCGTPFYLRHAADGEQAIEYLDGTGSYADREEYPFPDLVLLDLRMPRLDGFEVLEWIRSNPATKTLPVVVLAGSSFRADVRRALELGANSYAVKPAKFEELQVLIDQIADVWLARERVLG